MDEIVLIRSFMPGAFIIPFRPSTTFVASCLEEKWWRVAPFSTIEFFEIVLKYGNSIYYSETAFFGYHSITSRWVW